MRINEESTWKLKVDGRNYINELNNIEKSIVELKEKQSQFQRGTKEYAEATKELKAMEAEYKKLRDSMDIAGMSVKQLKQYKNDLVKEINGLVPGTEKYLEKTKQLSEVNTRLKHVQDDIRAVHDEAKPDRWTRFKELLTAAFTITGILELVSTLRQFGSEAIDMAVKLTDTYADMQKATAMSAKEVENLDNKLKNIDTRTSQDGLRQMTVVAGQLGIAKDEVEGFVVGVDKANVALGDEFQGGIEEISKSLGGLKRIFSDTKELKYDEALTRIGSSLNTLGATGSAKAPDIANFASRVAQLGDLAPKTAGEILGLGSGFLELNVSAEIASSGLKNVLTTGAANIKGFSNQLGISTAEMEKLINTNPNDFLFKLAESFKGATPTQMVAQLKQLGINSQEGQGAVMLLAKNTQFFRDRQTTANQAFKEGTSIQEEFNIKNNNAAAILDKQTKAIDLQKEALGKQLLPLKIKFFEVVGAGIPIISGLITVVGFLTSALIALPKFIWDNKSAFGFLTLAIVTLNGEMLVATATQLAKTAVDKGAVLWTNAQTAAQTALNLAMRANPIGLVITALSALIGVFMLVYNNSVTVRAGVQGIWAGIKQLGTEIWNFYNALLSLDFEKLKDIMVNAAKRIMSASNNAYNEELKKGKAEEKKIRDAGHDDDKDGHAAKENAKTKKEQEEIEKRNKENEAAMAAIQADLAKGTGSHATHQETRTSKKKKELDKQISDVRLATNEEIDEYRRSQEEFEHRSVLKANAGEALLGKKIQLIDLERTAEERLKDRILEIEEEKKRKRAETAEASYNADKQYTDAAKALLDGNISQFADGMENKISATARFKLKSIGMWMELASAVTDRINEMVAQFASFATGMIDLAQKGLAIKMALFEKEKFEATQAKRDELREVENIIADHDLEIARLRVEMLNTKDEARRADLQKEIDRLEAEKDYHIATKDLTNKEIDKIERDLDNKNRAAKLENWKRTQQLEIQMAIINMVQAQIKALSSGFPPINFMNATMVGLQAKKQVEMIRAQVPPQFTKGGYAYVKNAGVPVGPRHGSSYGQSGIALLDRSTGQEVGEMEGGEPVMILSRNTYANNRPLIDKLMESSLYRNGAPVFRDGGLLDPRDVIEPLRYGQSYLFGSRRRKKAMREVDAAMQEAMSLSNMVTGDNSEEAVSQLTGIFADAQMVAAENAGLTVEVLNEIASGLGRYLPEFEAIMRQQISQAEMLRQLIDLQTAILNRISDNTGRTADAAAQSKRNDL